MNLDLSKKTGTVAYAEFIYNGKVAIDKIGQKISTLCYIADGKIWINATSENIPQDIVTKWTEL